ncbi:MAG: TonB-dependent receptor plug domain-containing protein [Bacteroides sp.]|nr:TonB-dependent receptor plug domain-containing protein [Bacteroides sp.]
MKKIVTNTLFFLFSSVIPVLGQEADTLKTVALDEVIIVKPLNHLSEMAEIDLKVVPVNSSQEVLRRVPGLFIAQHAGGGKAEQLFLRGFDLDHGTDICITVDGMPVNMVSHAHGQGYADLHFLQPEAIGHIDFDKGPYTASKGNLSTAGYVDFRTKDRMPNEVAAEVGQYRTQRLRFSYSLLDNPRNSLYVSSALLLTDGYFDAPQQFQRLNLMGKYTYRNNDSRFSIMLSHFNSQWSASGQIPWRAVKRGLIGRFGALDDTEGGNTARSDLNITYLQTFGNGAELSGNAWLSHYRFNLYSNFTFFLNDADNGDQINQREGRLLAGAQSAYKQQVTWGEISWSWQGGLGFRYDCMDDLSLFHTYQRQPLDAFARGDARESNLYAYAGVDIEWGNWLIHPALRLDCFTFNYIDRLHQEFHTSQVRKQIVCPKLSLVYRPSSQWLFLCKLGKGFHSNDVRVVVSEAGKNVLPAAYGADLGLQWRPLSTLILNASLWYLQMEQEMVYVGDEAVVEAAGRSRRLGVDVGLRWDFLPYFHAQTDYTYSHARSMDEPDGENFIPLAPVHTLSAGVTYTNKDWTAGIKTRFLSNRPADEAYTLTARGYWVTDVNAAYTYKRITVGCIVENLFNTAWEEAQFATETRLTDEALPITEIHFTPGTPFSARAYVALRF